MLQEVPDNSVFFSFAIKLREDFKDKNGFFSALNGSSMMKDVPYDLCMKFENGYFIITGVLPAPPNADYA